MTHDPMKSAAADAAATAAAYSARNTYALGWEAGARASRLEEGTEYQHLQEVTDAALDSAAFFRTERDAAIARADEVEAVAERWEDRYCQTERARDEVGIQYAAAQAEIARMQRVVDAARASLVVTSDAGDSWDAKRDLADALRALDTVPGDALAPTLKVESGPGFEVIRAIHATWAMTPSERRVMGRLMAGEFVEEDKGQTATVSHLEALGIDTDNVKGVE